MIYVGFTNGTVQVSTNHGMTFSSLSAQPFTSRWVTGISVDPTNAKAITASFSFSDTRYAARLAACGPVRVPHHTGVGDAGRSSPATSPPRPP